MTVRTAMIEGRSSVRARRMAASIAPTSVPSLTRQGVPAVGAEAVQDVLAEGHRRRAVELDLVVVVEHHQLAEAEVPGEAGGLRRDPLLEVAVGADGVGPVVDDLVARPVELRGEAALGDGHADGVGHALAQRTGGRLHARRHAELGMTGRARAPLAEVLQLLEREVVAGQVEERVEEHRGVPGGEHEAVAVRPVGVRRGMVQEPRPQRVRHRRHAHRGAGMAGVGLLDAVDGQGADRVDGEQVELLGGEGGHRGEAPVRGGDGVGPL